MNNNIENNIGNNPGVGNGINSTVLPNATVTTGNIVTNTVTTPANTVTNTVTTPANTVTNTVDTPANIGVTVTPTNDVATNVNDSVQETVVNGQGNYKNFYILMAFIVGFVLLIAVVLLIFLLNGSIGNRNRLTCTKVTQEEGYTYTVNRYYTLEGGINKRVDFVYTYSYYDEFTDDMYNETFADIISNVTHRVTRYGLGTNISKEGNVVTITAYEPSYYDEKYADLKDTNIADGFTCK